MMPETLDTVLKQVATDLSEALGDNLYSCCLYGSAVRGNFDDDASDINLLLLLNQSDVHAHILLADVLQKHKRIDPFILAKRGFERSFRMFSPKFASIQRHYRVLFGADPIASLKVKPEEERFLTEQAFRNLRLRLVYAFVTRRHHPNAYERFIVRNATPLFVQLSDILRLNDVPIPKEFRARVPLFEDQFKIDGSVLYDLLELKANRKKLSDKDTVIWHERLFPLIDRVLVWIEETWPSNLTGT
jgi:predicted nucleotidyltransferase